jgi:hypothetical protein
MNARITRKAFVIAALLLCVIAIKAHADTITVINTNDSGPGSLRQALADANDGDTIDFDQALNGQMITVTSAELVIDKSITITGPGPDLLTVNTSGLQLIRIFHVMPGQTVTIDGLKIEGETFLNCSGGILNDDAALTVSNCAVEGNCSDYAGGGIYMNGGSLTILNSSINNNRLLGGFGANGGGISAGGTLTITDSEVNSNSATSKGENDFSTGGGISGGVMTITNSTINGNYANYAGGGIAGGDGTITNSTINGNMVTPFDGVGAAGGIFCEGPNTLTITGCTVSGNTAALGGAGIVNFGTLTIASSTLSNNSAIGGMMGSGTGGGIDNSGSLDVSNSTLSGNFAAAQGGGVYNRNSGAATLIVANSTLNGNSGVDGGAIYNAAMVSLVNTILNRGGAKVGANMFNSGGTVTSLGYNVSSDAGGGYLTGPGDQINTDPLLGPLQDNGGPTFTHELLPGSPAIDAGDPNFTPPPFYDQRGPGFNRVVNSRIDVGSFEVQTTPTPTATPTSTPTPTPTVTPTPRPTPTPRLRPTPRMRPTPSLRTGR